MLKKDSIQKYQIKISELYLLQAVILQFTIFYTV